MHIGLLDEPNLRTRTDDVISWEKALNARGIERQFTS